MKLGIIYGLYHPITGEIRYIGKTIRPNKRLNEHIEKATKGPDYPVYRWIRKLLRENLKPELEIIECATEDQLAQLEIFYIAKAKELGWNLLNATNGGEGVSGHVYTEEQRQKFRDAWNKRRLVPISEETRKKLSLSKKGIPKTRQQKRKMSEAALGAKNHNFDKKLSPESIKKRSAKLNTKIICNENGMVYESCKQASLDLNLSSSNVSRVVRGIHKHTKGYTFKLYTNVLET